MLYYICNRTNQDVTFWYRGQKVTIIGGGVIHINLKHIPFELANLISYNAVVLDISTNIRLKKNK